MMAKRKGMSKRLRYAVFERDGFTCRYCGHQPPTVKLVIDHMIPVSKGGTNDEANLLTSCEACNGGKSDKMPKRSAPTEAERLRMAQENLEQISVADLAREAAESRQRLSDEICEYWCQVFAAKSMRRDTLSRLILLVNEFDPATVFEWIDRSYTATSGTETYAIKYIYGCARNHRKQLAETA